MSTKANLRGRYVGVGKGVCAVPKKGMQPKDSKELFFWIASRCLNSQLDKKNTPYNIPRYARLPDQLMDAEVYVACSTNFMKPGGGEKG